MLVAAVQQAATGARVLEAQSSTRRVDPSCGALDRWQIGQLGVEFAMSCATDMSGDFTGFEVIWRIVQTGGAFQTAELQTPTNRRNFFEG
jgi:hypothetical protein